MSQRACQFLKKCGAVLVHFYFLKVYRFGTPSNGNSIASDSIFIFLSVPKLPNAFLKIECSINCNTLVAWCWRGWGRRQEPRAARMFQPHDQKILKFVQPKEAHPNLFNRAKAAETTAPRLGASLRRRGRASPPAGSSPARACPADPRPRAGPSRPRSGCRS